MKITIGDHLYLVKGAVHWALYDLKQEKLTVMDKKSAYFLTKLSEILISATEKRNFIQNNARPIWIETLNLGICERLFEPDTSIDSNNLVLDLLWLEITEICNERCSHCYGDGGPMRKNSMPVNLVKKIIKQGNEAGFTKLQFTGGEPLMHKNLWEIVEYACGLHYQEIEIYTNLTLAREKDIQRFKKWI